MSSISSRGDVVTARGAFTEIDQRTLDILERRSTTSARRRGWLVRRALVLADMVGLVSAFAISTLFFANPDASDVVQPGAEALLFALTLPLWILLAHLHGLYDRDEERADHSTVDDMVGVLHLVTVGTWIVFLAAWATNIVHPQFARLVSFWTLALLLVVGARSTARAISRRHVLYVQNAVILGAGDVGQLVARKVRQHPEYGINLVGFVDDRPKDRRTDIGNVGVLGPATQLEEIVRVLDVERIIVAFSNEPDDETMDTLRTLRDHEVQIDVVPRLYELVGPRAGVHSIEGLPLVGVPPCSLSRPSLLLKRSLDLVAASLMLLVTAPLFLYAAVRIKRGSDGPVFFRQVRLGLDMKEFTALKFRTMAVGTDENVHREYINRVAESGAVLEDSGMYKLDRSDAVTPFGRWLRKTSLDELPQLLNVLKGDMSLVGPRPCIPYETAIFEPHHFERFRVPQGITGLWQVTARANSTFGEALEMDVAYVRGWSIGLDLRLLFRTPFALLRQRKATA